jgi:flagellar basal-body rod protein FlgF
MRHRRGPSQARVKESFSRARCPAWAAGAAESARLSERKSTAWARIILGTGLAPAPPAEPERSRRMDLASTVALSRMDADMRAMDVTADNLSNADTAGFKTEHVLFTDWLARQSAMTTPRGERSISFAQDRATWRDGAAGALSHTGNPLDLALNSDGYFTVGTPHGPRLTRDGRFGLLPNGTIADSNGEPLLDVNGQPITVSVADTVLTVAGDGTLSSENGRLAKIGVVAPNDPRAVTAEGGTLLRADAPTAPVQQPRLVQGAVEESNVKPVVEVSKMIEGYRRFQFLSEFVRAEATRQSAAIDKLLPAGSGG